MSVENGKVCCNCRHCIRVKLPEYGTICHCEVTGNDMGYVQVMDGWCRHWAKEKEVCDGQEQTGVGT